MANMNDRIWRMDPPPATRRERMAEAVANFIAIALMLVFFAFAWWVANYPEKFAATFWDVFGR